MKSLPRILIVLLITAGTASLMATDFAPLVTLEAKVHDYLFQIRGPQTPPEDVVIAAIDEKSIDELGRWPWSRKRIATLVDRLREYEAGLIVFDIIFSEDEPNDPALAQAIDKAGNVLLPLVFSLSDQTGRQTADPILPSAYRNVHHPEAYQRHAPIAGKGVLMPVPALLDRSMGSGHINMFPDRDGTLRWESLVIAFDGYLFPSLSVSTAATWLGIPPQTWAVDATRGVEIGGHYLPTDEFGRTLIHYYGPGMTFAHISISDILAGRVDPEQLRDRIVLVGATAVGIYDLRVTPFSAAMPGIEKHANVIASILEGKSLRQLSAPNRLLFLGVSGLLFGLFLPRLHARGEIFATGLFMVALAAGGYYLFLHYGIRVPIAAPALNALFIFVAISTYNYAVEEIQGRKIRSMFSSYVTERVVSELMRNPGLARLGGDRREVTILFSDIANFTSFSEKQTPEDVVGQLNEYLGAMTEVILKWEGTLDKFIGDAIMAFWGAPLKQEDHAERAVRCALEMQQRLAEMRQKWEAAGSPALETGIGINSGAVLVGNIGAEGKKMDYTVIGDHVNLGARVESLTRKYQTPILLTEYTLQGLRPAIVSGKVRGISMNRLERVVVKGKETPVAIYSIAALDADALSTIEESTESETVVRLQEK